MTEPELLAVPLEVRAVDEPKRIAELLVCRYGEVSRRTERPERFLPGAFTESVLRKQDRLKITDAHTDGTGVFRRMAVARPVAWHTADPVELRATVKFFDDDPGHEAFCKARDGEYTGGSVGFQPVQERTSADGIREIVTAALHHFALIDGTRATPAYDAPRVLEVRVAALDWSLLDKNWDPARADACVDPGELARIGREVARAHY